MISGMYSVTNMFPVQNYWSSCLCRQACHIKYRICSRNLGTFFSILAAEKSGCV